ncbi:MAG: flagellar hook-length control protein FliK, partial [Planctomycetes bacterium]|nr:flagellar hook-length control protein FliK [Planctomycetota bacterium]
TATPARAAAVAPGYRTTDAAAAERLEQARDSVFKQILVQLTADGGEMRVRLQPPELGELDLRLVVEDGNRLTLTIAAERADLTQLLQKHLDQLKQTLQASGLQVADAQVHQRGAGGAGEQAGFGPRQRRHAANAEPIAPAPFAAPGRGWISAAGLDFWA